MSPWAQKYKSQFTNVHKNDRNPFLHDPNLFLLSTCILPGWWNNYLHCWLLFPFVAHSLEVGHGAKTLVIKMLGYQCAYGHGLSLHDPFRPTAPLRHTPLLRWPVGPACPMGCELVAWRLHLACRCASFGPGCILKTFEPTFKSQESPLKSQNFMASQANQKL